MGYDEETMPASAKGQNKSYHDYIMGLGYDKVEKTPEWAAEITLVPAEKIRELAAKIHDAKAVFVVQGWGLQRHSNGESATRAVCMLALLTGNLGKPGTNSGMARGRASGSSGWQPAVIRRGPERCSYEHGERQDQLLFMAQGDR